MKQWRLVSDVGGSNVRFAWSSGGHALSERRSYALKDYASFYGALGAFLDETGGRDGCESAAIGVAGPVDDGSVKLTNAAWTIEVERVSALLGGAPAGLVNDLQAVALALPNLKDAELAPIGSAGRRLAAPRTMLAVNVGTGFGAASAIPVANGWITNPGEPGHMTLGASDAAQCEILAGLRSVEDVLSGRGVPPLYERLARHAGQPRGIDGLSAAEIFARAGEDEVAAAAFRLFSDLLGRVAGDLTLAAAAWGGVYLCGSVVNGWAQAGGGQYFRAPFEDKGPMRSRMQGVYSGVITSNDIALLGLTYLPV